MKTTSGFRVEDLIPTRYSLLSRLQNRDDHESWREFFECYWRLIFTLAIQAGLSDAEAQDVVQETVICVARDLEKFKRDRALGTFKGWLRNIIRWRICDQLRKRGRLAWPEPERGQPVPMVEEIPEDKSVFDLHWAAEWHANLFEAALERIKQRVREEHYQIFQLHVMKGWPVLKVAQAMNVNAAQVYLIKHRISAQLKKEIQAIEKKLF
jgi:RNA polymerase sigma-70 factor (ECF subfamily)